MTIQQKRNNSAISNTTNEKSVVNLRKTSNAFSKKDLQVGEFCNFKITAFGPNNVGIDEYTYSTPVFIPLGKSEEISIGSKVKGKVVKKQESIYSVAELIENNSNQPKKDFIPEHLEKGSELKAGQILIVSLKPITSLGSLSQMKGNPESKRKLKTAVAELPNNYKLFVPVPLDSVLDNAKVIVTRVKEKYAFAKLIQSLNKNEASSNSLNFKNFPSDYDFNSEEKKRKKISTFEVGSKFTVTLNKDVLQNNTKGNFLVLNVNNIIVFIKFKNKTVLTAFNSNNLRVRVKITSKSENCAIGKILQINPLTTQQKKNLVLKKIREMINHGMHFGEKAIKCHARMKSYIWSGVGTPSGNPTSNLDNISNSKLLGATSLAPYPLVKKGRHVINLLKTRRCLNQALNKLTKFALKGRTFLFIGTKKPAAGLISRASFFTKNSFYVNTRWLGGMLTNWKTICKSISKIRPILKEKQKVVREILERRQSIKTRLIKKALLLRKKSKLILSKAQILIEKLRKDKSAHINQLKQLTVLRNELVSKGLLYLEKRKNLIKKRKELILKAQTLLLKEKRLELTLKHKAALNQLAIYLKKLREYKYLLILTTEIDKIKQTSNNQLLSVSYKKLKTVLETTENTNINSWVLPNPPKELLNKMVLTCLQASSSFENNNQNLNKDGNTKTKNQFIVCSTLISKFANFGSYIKSVIKSLLKSIQILENKVKLYSTQLNKIKTTFKNYLELKQKYIIELQKFKNKLIQERAIIRIVKRKLKALDAQKNLLKFLPRLRYLPTPKTKISEIVQILLAKIVDPKLKYPIENIYDQKLNSSSLGGGSKKLAAARKKKWQRLEKYFGGIANMTKLTKSQISNNVAIIIGQKEEINSVFECKKLGIKMFTIVDTNCNPTLCDHIIPANDDSRSSIKYILTQFITRIRLAQKLRSRLLIANSI